MFQREEDAMDKGLRVVGIIMIFLCGIRVLFHYTGWWVFT